MTGCSLLREDEESVGRGPTMLVVVVLVVLLVSWVMLGSLVRSAVPLRVEAMMGEVFDCCRCSFLCSRDRDLSTAALAIGCCCCLVMSRRKESLILPVTLCSLSVMSPWACQHESSDCSSTSSMRACIYVYGAHHAQCNSLTHSPSAALRRRARQSAALWRRRRSTLSPCSSS